MAHRLSLEAAAELDGIWYYIAHQSGSVDIADRFIDSLAERFYLLSLSPTSAAVAMTICVPALRSFLVGEFVILYRIEDEDVLILHVVRGSGTIQALFGY